MYFASDGEETWLPLWYTRVVFRSAPENILYFYKLILRATEKSGLLLASISKVQRCNFYLTSMIQHS